MPYINLNFTSTTQPIIDSDEYECCVTHDNGCCEFLQVFF